MDEKAIDDFSTELQKKLEEFCKELAPFFDSIQIFASKHENDDLGTTRFSHGIGNFHARYGQIVQWIKREDAYLIKDLNKSTEED